VLCDGLGWDSMVLAVGSWICRYQAFVLNITIWEIELAMICRFLECVRCLYLRNALPGPPPAGWDSTGDMSVNNGAFGPPFWLRALYSKHGGGQWCLIPEITARGCDETY